MSNFKFIDLFAGLGGFHVAMEKLGGECVFASEKKEILRNLYKDNFGLLPNSDISKIDVKDIPSHDMLCAGFPCQPFSKAGSQFGLKDEKNGYLFDVIVEILEEHEPNYFILENVRNLEKHEGGQTIKYMIDCLSNYLNYDIDYNILSPHQFGIPQHRERFFMVGSKKGLGNFKWPKMKASNRNSVFDVISRVSISNSIPLEKEKVKALNIWQAFLDRIPNNVSIPGPLWSMEFGATYPFEGTTPFATSSRKLGALKGSFGTSLKGLSRNDKFNTLPSYARVETNTFPKWKENFIRKNRDFYCEYGHLFEDIIGDIINLGVSSWQKLEWNVKGEERKVFNYLIQFRGSGIRLKRTDYFPSLVTVSTQIPIIGWELRYLTKEEGARLQSLEKLKLPESNSSAFSALGNAVNARVVYKIGKRLLSANHKKNNKYQLALELKN